MQKINFISHFLLKMLQRNSKFGHTWSHTFKRKVSIGKTFDVYLQKKKSTSSFTFSLRYCKRYWNLVTLGTLKMPGYAQPKWYYQFVENLCVYLLAKNQLHFQCFSADIAKICKLLWLSNRTLKLEKQNFVKYGTGGEILTIILVFILDYL